MVLNRSAAWLTKRWHQPSTTWHCVLITGVSYGHLVAQGFLFSPRKTENEVFCVIPLFFFLCKKGLSNREVADIFFVFLLSYQMYLIHFFPSLRASTVCHLMSVVMRELAKSILQLSIFILFSIFSLNRWRGEEVKGNLLLFDLLFLFFWWQNSLRLKTDSKLISVLQLHKRNVTYTSCISRD